MSRNADFWSRRKARVKAEEETAANTARRAEAEKALATRNDAEILDELDLPDPDTLNAGDDFRAFMREAVPDRLRRRALRRLWTSNPALANLDALVDYGEDYTDSATVVANLQTAYQVGKGILRKVDQTADALSPPDAEPADLASDDTASETAEDRALDAAAVDAPRAPAEAFAETETAPAAPRRMRFAFTPDGPDEERS